MAKLISSGFFFGAVIWAAMVCGLDLGREARADQPLQRQANTTLQMPAEFPTVGYGVTNAFGDLLFNDPVAIASVPGETNRIFIVDRPGTIWVITNLTSPTKTEFLDATEALRTDGEEGLLGLAFHPGYATNGYFYIYRMITTNIDEVRFGRHAELARYTADPQNPARALPGSKQRVLIQYDDNALHNGGSVQFGPDGYLYLSIGDASPAPDEDYPDPQPIDRHFFGTILRIDVDHRPGNLPPNPHPGGTEHYLIPHDNPFIGATSHNGRAVSPGQVRTEIFALGLRNPWRMSFDGTNLYCGDVGGGSWEEVDVIRAGGNYGWPYFEAERPNAEPPAGFSALAPLYSYSRGNRLTNGHCVIGGVVYRGQRIPQLQGAYIFGDTMNGHIWALRHDGGTTTNVVTVAGVPRVAGLPSLTSFGLDPANGDVLVSALDDRIYRLVYVPPATVAHPATLADTGVFSDLQTLTPQPGVVPYEVSVPFWSDHAIKQRWFSLPDPEQKIGFTANTNWSFPTGAVWIKHFEMEMTNGSAASRRRLETRFLVKNPAGVYALTYRWGDSMTNAWLVGDGGFEEDLPVYEGNTLRLQRWVYPGRNDCLACHNPTAGLILGFNTPQMNCRVLSNSVPVNQIQFLDALGYFSNAVANPHGLAVMARATNSAAPIQDRVRSYFQANCVSCHNSAGVLANTWDARISVPMTAARIINGPAYAPPDYRVIAPGDLEKSLLRYRVTSDFARMPPLGSTVQDTNGIDLLTEYIMGLPVDPWSYRDIGTPGREGSSSVLQGVHRVSGSGQAPSAGAEALHYLSQPFTGNAQMTARLLSLQGDEARAGLMFRSSTASNAAQASLRLGTGGSWEWQRRLTNGAESVATHYPNPAAASWLRLVREGPVLRAYTSAGSNDWTLLAEDFLDLGGSPLLGLAITSSNEWTTATAAFEQVRATTVRLLPPAVSSVLVTESIELDAEVSSYGTTVQSVQFYDGTNQFAEAFSPPYAALWTHPLAGERVLRARAVDAAGGGVFSEPLTLTRTLPQTQVIVGGIDTLTSGQWEGGYGEEGFVLAGVTTNLPPFVAFSLTGETVQVWDPATTQPRALEDHSPPDRVAAAWSAPTNLSVQLTLLDGAFHQVSLYFLDWETGGQRAQRVEVFDLASGTLLASAVLTNFSAGAYLTYLVRGTIEIRVTSLSGHSAVCSGLFVDSPTVQLLPSVRFENGYFTFDVLRKKAAPNTAFVVEMSKDLVVWTPATNGVVTQSGLVDLGSRERVSLQITNLAQPSARCFVRLRF